MKKLFLIALIFVLALSSCERENDVVANYEIENDVQKYINDLASAAHAEYLDVKKKTPNPYENDTTITERPGDFEIRCSEPRVPITGFPGISGYTEEGVWFHNGSYHYGIHAHIVQSNSIVDTYVSADSCSSTLWAMWMCMFMIN